MNKTIKLFIGGIPPTATKKELAGIFKEYEPDIRIELKMDKRSHLNKGFAFILVKDPLIASKIVATQYMIRGRSIQVQNSKRVPKSQHVAPLRLFCKGIPWGASDADLTAFFSSLAPCRAAYAIKDAAGKHKGFGFVELYTKEGAQTLLGIKKIKFKEAYLKVEEYNKPHRYREPGFHDQNANMAITGSSKNCLISQGRFKQQVDSDLATDSHRLLTENIPRNSSLYQTSRTSVWKFDDGGFSNEPKAYKNQHKDINLLAQADDLFKIGPQKWILTSPRKEWQKGSTQLHHQTDNLKFNILPSFPSNNLNRG